MNINLMLIVLHHWFSSSVRLFREIKSNIVKITQIQRNISVSCCRSIKNPQNVDITSHLVTNACTSLTERSTTLQGHGNMSVSN